MRRSRRRTNTRRRINTKRIPRKKNSLRRSKRYSKKNIRKKNTKRRNTKSRIRSRNRVNKRNTKRIRRKRRIMKGGSPERPGSATSTTSGPDSRPSSPNWEDEAADEAAKARSQRFSALVDLPPEPKPEIQGIEEITVVRNKNTIDELEKFMENLPPAFYIFASELCMVDRGMHLYLGEATKDICYLEVTKSKEDEVYVLKYKLKIFRQENAEDKEHVQDFLNMIGIKRREGGGLNERLYLGGSWSELVAGLSGAVMTVALGILVNRTDYLFVKMLGKIPFCRHQQEYTTLREYIEANTPNLPDDSDNITPAKLPDKRGIVDAYKEHQSQWIRVMEQGAGAETQFNVQFNSRNGKRTAVITSSVEVEVGAPMNPMHDDDVIINIEEESDSGPDSPVLDSPQVVRSVD